MVTRIWLITSGGVINAERIRITTIACLRYFFNKLELIIPTLLSKYNINTEDCEHIDFHKTLYDNNFKLVINKNFKKRYSDIETWGGFYSKYDIKGNLKI